MKERGWSGNKDENIKFVRRANKHLCTYSNLLQEMKNTNNVADGQNFKNVMLPKGSKDVEKQRLVPFVGT